MPCDEEVDSVLILEQMIFLVSVAGMKGDPIYLNWTLFSILEQILGISSVPESTRYQLLHRTASGIIEAQRFNAASAVMLVHSFSQSNEWFQDFAAFVSLMGGVAAENGIISVGNRSGVALYLAWVHGNNDYLNK